VKMRCGRCLGWFRGPEPQGVLVVAWDTGRGGGLAAVGETLVGRRWAETPRVGRIGDALF
jgi:hypothetical protein